MDPLSLPRPAVRAFAAALILLISLVFVLTLIPSAYAATPIYVRTDGNDVECDGTADVAYPGGSGPLACAVQTIGQGVALVDPGGTVYVRTGVYVLSAVVNANKTGITLDGDGAGATIVQVSGSGDRFDISASGVTMQDFEIEKTDTAGPQDIIRISNGNNVTIKNNTIHGQYVYPAGDVSRALIVNAGAFSGLNIEGNTIYKLRQPAYISGTHTGTVQNNHTYSTKGWVLEGGNLTFTGNTWGSGAQANVYDIAILSAMPGGYYTDIVAMSNANNEAVIEDQRVGPAVLSVVYVDDSAPVCSDCGGGLQPYQSIGPAVTRVVAGGKIKVAAGTYAETVSIDKGLTLQCAQAGVPVGSRTAGSGAETIIDASGLAKGIIITANNVKVDGCDVAGNSATYAGVQIYATLGTGNRSSVDVVNNFIHGMALPNPSSSAYVTSYGVFGLGDLNGGTRLTLTDVAIQGNAIYNLGGVVSGPDTSAGAGVWLYGVQGASPGLGADVSGNTFDDIYSGLDGGVPEPGVGVAVIDDGDGVPDQGASIAGNSYSDTFSGVVAFIGNSSVAEAGANFSNVTLLALNVGNLATVNEATLAKYAKSDMPTGYPSSTAYFAKINDAIANSDAGAAISVTAGTFNENVVVNKRVTVTGVGSGAGDTVISSSAGGSGGVVQLAASGLSASQPILLKDLRIQPTGMAGISVGQFTAATGTNVSYVELDNVHVVGTNTNPCTEQERGLYVDLTSSLTNLKISDSAFDNLHYGWYLHKQVSADTSTVQFVDVDDTTFNHNNFKGLYAEKLEDATFTGVTVNQNGYDNSMLGLCSYFGPFVAGVDVNLKAGAYQNLTFDNATVTNNALGNAKEGVGLTVKARDDGVTYGAFPATLTNVTIDDGLVTGNERGIRIGEPGKNNAGPTNVVVEDVCISGNVQTYSGVDGSAYGGLVNQSLASVDAENNWWGSATGPTNPSNPGGTGDAVYENGPVDFTPWLNACGGSPTGNFHNITDNTFFATMQAAVNAASYGDIIVPLAAGPFGAEGSATVAVSGVTIRLSGRTFGPGSPAFTITGNDVTIVGPGVIDGGGSAFPGILVQPGAGNFTLRDAEVKGWADGIQVAGAVVSLKLIDNWIHNNTDAGLQVDATPSGVITINGNLFKANGGDGVVYGGSGLLKTEYNSWGDLGGPNVGAGDGANGASVDFTPWTFSELYMDVDPPAYALTRSVPETTSFDVALRIDAAKLYGLTFQFTYDPAMLTLNTTTFTAPWAGGPCVPLPASPGVIKYRCNLTLPAAQYDATGGTIATFNFTANTMGPGNGPWPTYFDISHLPANTSSAAVGGIKVFVNNAGYGAPSAPARGITNTDDGEIIIVGLANFTGFVDLQGNTNDSGATLLVKNQLAKAGAVDLASGVSVPSGAYTTAHLPTKTVLVGSTYWLQFDAPLHLPTTTVIGSITYPTVPNDWTNSALATTRPLTPLAFALLLGGDATNNDVVTIDDATCIGAFYQLPFTDCGGAPGSSPDVKVNGAVDIFDLVLMGSNYELTYSPWAQP